MPYIKPKLKPIQLSLSSFCFIPEKMTTKRRYWGNNCKNPSTVEDNLRERRNKRKLRRVGLIAKLSCGYNLDGSWSHKIGCTCRKKA